MRPQSEHTLALRRRLVRNVKLCFAIRAGANSLAFVIATIVLLWQKIGLSQSQIFLLEALFALVLICLQIPMGLLADRIGRKRALLIGAASVAVGCVTYMGASDFWSALAAEILIGVGIAAVSGADEALLYDSLAALRLRHKFAVLWGEAQMWGFRMACVGCALGAFVAQMDLRLPFVFALAGTLAMVLSALCLVEPHRSEDAPPKLSPGAFAHVVKTWFVRHPEARWLMLFGATTHATLQVAVWMYPLYFKGASMPVWSFGLVFAGYNLVASFAGSSIRRLVRKRRLTRREQNRVFWVLIMTLAVSYWAYGAHVWIAGCVFGAGHQIVRAIMPVLVSQALNDLTDSRFRASVISLGATCNSVAYFVALTILSLTAEGTQVTSLLTVMGIVALAVGGTMLRLRPT